MKDDVKTKDGIQVIARAAAVLRALKDSQTGLSLGQIADRVALPRSTVQRIVAALIDERLLIATRAAGVRLGPGPRLPQRPCRTPMASHLCPQTHQRCVGFRI